MLTDLIRVNSKVDKVNNGMRYLAAEKKLKKITCYQKHVKFRVSSDHYKMNFFD